jgi:hypothetical protein
VFDWGGSATLDECGICDGDNSTCTDCNGDVNGGAFIDGCGDCVGGNTGLWLCAFDCNGVDGGVAYFDSCGECVVFSDTSCIQGCDGNYANDGLLAYWNFNAGSGDILYDHSSNQNHGTINGARWIANGTIHVAPLIVP